MSAGRQAPGDAHAVTRVRSIARKPGSARRPRDPIGLALRAVDRIAASDVLDRIGRRQQAERLVHRLTRSGFVAITRASRAFAAARPGPAARPAGRPRAAALFDLTPTDDQKMLVEVVREFAAEQVRPAAADADSASAAPDAVLATAAELGITQLGVPEEAGGLAGERAAVTNVLVAEALAHGDMGIAVACLAPAAVGGALSLWGSGAQQSRYLPAFVGERPPAAALTLLEPRAAFDPLELRARAVPLPGGGYRLDGEKTLVPLATSAELFVVGAELEGRGPVLFVVESGTAGLGAEADPAMGLRAAATGRLVLDGVRVPADALLAGDGADDPEATAVTAYRECVRLSRLGWCALALGTGQAVLDYVIPYVKEREAFGEPIAHRQAVAFAVADMAIELEGMRMVTYRAAGRVEQGLDARREIAAARRLCAEHGMTIGSNGVQVLGGHGYVKEHPVERWYRDLRAVGVMEGVVLA